MKIIATDYKDKHFVLRDENTINEIRDIIDEEIDVEKILASDRLLARHIQDCQYYGIPPYIGKDEDLKKRINKLQLALYGE